MPHNKYIFHFDNANAYVSLNRPLHVIACYAIIVAVIIVDGDGIAAAAAAAATVRCAHI